MSMQFIDPGLAYLHGGPCRFGPCRSISSTNSNSSATSDEIKIKVEDRIDEWVAYKDGSIPCPPEARGGCGDGMLELKHILTEDSVSNLSAKAEELAEVHKIKDTSETPGQSCTCVNSVVNIDTTKEKLRKAASRISNDNYLYCPVAVDIQDEDKKHFQSHLFKGEPVIVSNVLETTYGLSWEPMVMERAFRQIKGKKHSELSTVVAVNCLSWCEVSWFLPFRTFGVFYLASDILLYFSYKLQMHYLEVGLC